MPVMNAANGESVSSSSERTPIIVCSANHAQTQGIGERLGRSLRAGDVVLLHGDLGAGKTTLAQGIARGLRIDDYVQSPTFTLVQEHDGVAGDGAPVRLYHLDLYRLTDPADLDSFGFDDYLEPADGVTVIEWPERAAGHLPERYLLVRLETTAAGERRLTFEPVPDRAAFADVLRAV